MRVHGAPSSEVVGLDPGDVHVWIALLDELDGAALRAPLSADERARGGRFHFERDRRRFVSARGLLRTLLGRYLEVDPATLGFGYGSRGKPFLAGCDELRFNVSHSAGLALLAFARGCELGVDIEQERPLPESEEIALRYFSAWEGAELRRLREDERGAAFFRCWTRKEAFIKATGDGLSRPLDAFDVSLAPGEPARLLRVLGEPEAPRRFWLEDLRPASGFAGALAVEGEPKRVVRRAWGQYGEVSHGSGRDGRQDGLQGRREPRGAVLHLAGTAREPARLA
jgi:4'-phosphopantetheinyl transferase